MTHDIDERYASPTIWCYVDGATLSSRDRRFLCGLAGRNGFRAGVFGRSELGVGCFSLRSVGDYVRRHEQLSGDALVGRDDARDALSMFVARRCDVLPVANQQGEPCGTLHFRDLLSGDVPS